MISKQQLESAVSAGVLDETTANALLAHTKNQPTLDNIVDEEHFRLVSGFNDIFVVIASLLLFTSLFWLAGELLGALLVAVTAWGLAEFFVLKRRMALPAIVLLLYFVSGIFMASLFMGDLFIASLGITGGNDQVIFSANTYAVIASCAITIAAAWLHWKRFKVPITVAAGATFVVGAIFAIVTAITASKTILMPLASVLGFGVFLLAMYWDASDTNRETRKSDIGFWLHLAAAPLIIHPIFELLGVLNGRIDLLEASIVLLLYLLIAGISLAIDRRALMVSALGYVIYVFSTLLTGASNSSAGFAITAFIIGSALLLLSAFWHQSRSLILKVVPTGIKQYLPK